MYIRQPVDQSITQSVSLRGAADFVTSRNSTRNKQMSVGHVLHRNVRLQVKARFASIFNSTIYTSRPGFKMTGSLADILNSTICTNRSGFK